MTQIRNRKFERQDVALVLTCCHSVAGSERVLQQAEVCNVSRGGLELQAPTLPERDDMVEFHGKVGEKRARFIGVVRWTQADTSSFGVELVRFDLGSKELWQAMLARFAGSP